MFTETSRINTQPIANAFQAPISDLNQENTTNLTRRISELVQNEPNGLQNYWKCFCCLCPRTLHSRVSTTSENSQREILHVFLKSIDSNIFKHSPLGISIHDENGYFIDCNNAYLAISGYSKEELTGKHYSTQFDKEDLQTTPIEEFRLDNGTDISQFEAKFKRKNETTFWSLITRSTVRDSEDRIVYFIDQALDISKNKNSQVSLEENLEKQKTFNERLLNTSNHEVRTYLGGMIGYLKILNEDFDTLNPEEMKNLLNPLHVSSNNLLSIINDNLDFAKITDGSFQILKDPFSLSDLLRDIHASCLSKINNTRVTIHFTIDPAVPIKIIGDITRIRQIIENLLSNAIKFTEDGQITLDITVENRMTENEEELFLNFEITNTGKEISPEVLGKLFKPYQQDSHSKRATGLGLPIAKILVEAMEGQMLPIRSPDLNKEGTTFSFYIKVERVTEKPSGLQIEASFEEISASAKSRLIGKRILIAEDTLSLQKIINRIMNKAGIQCVVVGNGQLAVDFLRQDPHFDLVLMDIQMPVMDGIQATKAIRNDLNLLNLPIMALTANGADFKSTCIEASMNEFSLKPYNEQDIFLKMDKLINETSVKI